MSSVTEGETTNPFIFFENLNKKEQKPVDEAPVIVFRCFHCSKFLPQNGRSRKNKVNCCGSHACKKAYNREWMRKKRFVSSDG